MQNILHTCIIACTDGPTRPEANMTGLHKLLPSFSIPKYSNPDCCKLSLLAVLLVPLLAGAAVQQCEAPGQAAEHITAGAGCHAHPVSHRCAECHQLVPLTPLGQVGCGAAELCKSWRCTGDAADTEATKRSEAAGGWAASKPTARVVGQWMSCLPTRWLCAFLLG